LKVHTWTATDDRAWRGALSFAPVPITSSLPIQSGSATEINLKNESLFVERFKVSCWHPAAGCRRQLLDTARSDACLDHPGRRDYSLSNPLRCSWAGLQQSRAYNGTLSATWFERTGFRNSEYLRTVDACMNTWI
jgi:hypothetical protein